MKNVNANHKQPVVCLDAGHYGYYNAGAVSGYHESKAMWKLHNYLATELESYGIKVTKTRTDQAKDMALLDRGRKAKGADLFLSLHSNACDTERVDRPEAIHLWDDDCGVIDARSKDIAGLLGEAVRDTMGTNDKAKVYARRASHDRDGDGKANDDYYGVLEGAHQAGAPAVILEHSFHTNKRACNWLMNDANLKKMAKAEAATIAKWFDVEKPASSPTPAVPAPAPDTVKEVVATEKARSNKNSTDSGAYKVTCNNLALRNGAGTEANSYGKDKRVLVRLDKGAKVQCWGYSTTVNGLKWLYVEATHNGVKYTGFMSSKYLKKV